MCNSKAVVGYQTNSGRNSGNSLWMDQQQTTEPGRCEARPLKVGDGRVVEAMRQRKHHQSLIVGGVRKNSTDCDTMTQCFPQRKWLKRGLSAVVPCQDTVGVNRLPNPTGPHSHRRVGKARRPFRHLSRSIALKRILLAVDLTVSSEDAGKNSCSFRRLFVPETIEWE